MSDKRAYLEGLHTRQLLKHLRGLRKWESKWHTSIEYADLPKDVQDEIDLCKEILATREHIPSKLEARKIRQLKAQGKCNANI